MISFNKKNLPTYVYKLSVALVTFFVLWFTAVVAVMATIGVIYGESVITYAVMCGGFGLFFIVLGVFWLVDIKLHKRFIEERTAELEKEFSDMPFEEAERILKEKRIITDTGFVAKSGDVFGEEIVSFDKARFSFNISVISEVKYAINMYTADDMTRKATYDFDKAMYNYIKNIDSNLKNNEAIALLQRDKRQFSKSIFNYTSKVFQWKFK